MRSRMKYDYLCKSLCDLVSIAKNGYNLRNNFLFQIANKFDILTHLNTIYLYD